MRDKKDDSMEDPIAAALGQTPTKRPRQPANKGAPPPPRPRVAVRKKPVPEADRLPEPTQQTNLSSHPEFSRLSFIFRQSIESNNLFTADQTFHRLEQMKLSGGLSDRILFQYVTLLAAQKRPVDALRPLQMISSRNAALADPARLRIAMIQIRVLNKPEAALRTLAQILETPEAKPEIIQKRNQLLAEAKQRAG